MNSITPMRRSRLRPRTVLSLLALLAAPALAPSVRAVWPPSTLLSAPANPLARILTAVAEGDFTAYVSNADGAFAATPRDAFTSLADRYGARLSRGYEAAALGTLDQDGERVSVWKITFADGSDDALATLRERDGKATRFSLR